MKEMVMKRLVYILLILSFITAVVACGGIIEDNPDSNEMPNQSVELGTSESHRTPSVTTTTIVPTEPDNQTPYESPPSATYERPLLDDSNYNVSIYDGLKKVVMKDLTILSFDFLSEYDNVGELVIINCMIPEGVVLPLLEDLEALDIRTIYGQDEFAFVNNSLPLPKLRSLFIANNGDEIGDVLLEIPSLEGIIVRAANPVEIIAHNSQIIDLVIFAGASDDVDVELPNLDGLERFHNLETLNIHAGIEDISPLSGCYNLWYLEILCSKRIITLKPLMELKNLEVIGMKIRAYEQLPQEDRDYFRELSDAEEGRPYVWLCN